MFRVWEVERRLLCAQQVGCETAESSRVPEKETASRPDRQKCASGRAASTQLAHVVLRGTRRWV